MSHDTTTSAEREARTEFELWFSDEGKTPSSIERSGDGYKLMQAQAAWWAWQAAWNRRAAMQTAEPVGPLVVPRSTLSLIYDAMNYMGDVLNGMDAVEPEDEAATLPAFDAVRALLAAQDRAPSTKPGIDHEYIARMEADRANLVAAGLAPDRAPSAKEAADDTKRLDWLNQQAHAYGFEDMHEGNKWEIGGPFADLRKAIDAAMKPGDAQ